MSELRKLRIAEQGRVAHFQSMGFFLDLPRHDVHHRVRHARHARNVDPSGWGQEDVLGLLKYEKQAADPLRIAISGKDEKLWVVSRKGTDRRIAVTGDFADWSYAIRLVVGPDIEKITREKLGAAKKSGRLVPMEVFPETPQALLKRVAELAAWRVPPSPPPSRPRNWTPRPRCPTRARSWT